MVSTWPTRLFGKFRWKASPLITTTTQLFSQCLPSHILCRALETFSNLTTPAISDAANSIKTVPIQFATGMIIFCRYGSAVIPITCASALNTLPHC